MASKSLGTLTLDLIANIGGYTAGLDKAQREAEKRAKAIEKVFSNVASGVGIAIGAAGAALAAGFAGFQVAIDSVAKFQDLAETTGAAADQIAGLSVAAATAGVNIEDVAGSMIKLTKNLEDVDKKGNETAQALKNLGINVAEFKRLDPVAQYEAIGKALANFADGAGKTSNALALFGKAGAEQLKVFKALEEQGGRMNILTAEQIKAADDYADAQAKSLAQLKLYLGALSTEALPAITAVTGAVKDLAKELVDGNQAQKDFGLNLVILNWAEKVALGIGTVAESIVGLVKTVRAAAGSFESVYADLKVIEAATPVGAARALITGSGGLTDALANREKVAKEANQRYKDLWTYDGTQITNAIKKSFANQRAVIQNMQDPEVQRLLARSKAGSGANLPTLKPIVAAPTGGGSGTDPAKLALDSQLKELDRYINRERELMGDRNKMLDLYNSQGLLSIKDYYAQRNTILQEGTKAQIDAIDQQIAALQAYIAKAPKPEERQKAQEKLNDLLEKQAKLEKDLGITAIETGIQQQKATESYQNDLKELNAQILELQGNLVEAANIRFDVQNAERYKKFAAEGNELAKQQLDYLKEIGAAQAGLAQAQASFGKSRSDLQRAEESIARDQQLGISGTIDGLVKLGEARKKALGGMQQAYAEFERLQASGVQFTSAQIQGQKELKNQIEDLSKSLDPLGEKFNTMFADKFGDAFNSIIDGSKSVKTALKDMVNSFVSDLVKLAAQDVFKSFLSGGGSATGGTGINFGSILSSFISGYRANGGPVLPNSMYKVNERGPEVFQAANGDQYLMTGSKGGRVNSNGAGFNQQLNVTIAGTPDPRTPSQIAQEVRRQTNTAQRRFS